MISIIIPFYNHADLVHSRLSEIYKFVDDKETEIILVNDASEELDCEGIVWFWQKNVHRHTIRYIRNKKNLGFGGSMNRGAKKAKGDILVFYSNDVVMSGNAIQQIEATLKANPKALVGGELIYWNAGWNLVEHNGKSFVIPWCNGWLLACTKEVWDNLGGFDPIYGVTDFEDVDLSTTALWLGYDLVGLNSPFLNHLGAQTANYGDARMEHTKHNRELYLQKWSSKWDELFIKLEGHNA